MGHRNEWERIVGANFDSVGLCHMGEPVVAIAPHPLTRGLGNEHGGGSVAFLGQHDLITRPIVGDAEKGGQ